PDVIIRDHPDNPGVDYIVSVVYTDAGVVTLNNYEVIGLPTVTVNLMSSTALNTATHPAGSQGAYPKIDGFVNPNNAIHAYRAMGGFAVTWETSAGVELQVFDKTATPFSETHIVIPNPSYPFFRITPEIAAIVEIDPAAPL